jgi:hypothetical protein
MTSAHPQILLKKNYLLYVHQERGGFNTPLSEKTKMSVCFWVYDAKKRKARKKCRLGREYELKLNKKKENCRITFKEEDLQLMWFWSTQYKF